LPRVHVVHTSASEIGQIYVPAINRVLMIASVGLVIGFGSSSRLAAAYGIAVNLDMVITTSLAYVVARRIWGWQRSAALAVTGTLLVIDLGFLGANSLKLLDGGWFPLVVGAGMMTVLTTWKAGRGLLAERFRARMLPLEDFWARILREGTPRVPGTAVYMSGASVGTPPALLTNFKHNHVVHQNVILLTIVTEEVARVPHAERLHVETLEHGFCRVVGRYGFMDDPDVPKLLARAALACYRPDVTTYYLGRETVIPTKHPGMALWREKLFADMSRNAEPATAHFKLPADRVMEIGAQIEI
jgi:KUP system potassium uptake protein